MYDLHSVLLGQQGSAILGILKIRVVAHLLGFCSINSKEVS
jgi:hypothetical protein